LVPAFNKNASLHWTVGSKRFLNPFRPGPSGQLGENEPTLKKWLEGRTLSILGPATPSCGLFWPTHSSPLVGYIRMGFGAGQRITTERLSPLGSFIFKKKEKKALLAQSRSKGHMPIKWGFQKVFEGHMCTFPGNCMVDLPFPAARAR